MPLIDIRCLTCGVTAEVNRPLSLCVGERPYPTPPCLQCGLPTEQIHCPSRYSTAPAVVAYRMPDGSFRFPGRSDSPLTRQYEAEGATRLELRGWADVRRFEGTVNAAERTKMERRFERLQRYTEEGTRRRRSEMQNAMKGMSDGAKHYGRYLMARNDNKPLPRIGDPGFRVEAFSESRSNREEARDDRGRKLRD